MEHWHLSHFLTCPFGNLLSNPVSILASKVNLLVLLNIYQTSLCL